MGMERKGTEASEERKETEASVERTEIEATGEAATETRALRQTASTILLTADSSSSEDVH